MDYKTDKEYDIEDFARAVDQINRVLYNAIEWDAAGDFDTTEMLMSVIPLLSGAEELVKDDKEVLGEIAKVKDKISGHSSKPLTGKEIGDLMDALSSAKKTLTG